MKLYSFNVEYFNQIDWEYRNDIYMAESEQQIRDTIDKKCPLDCRYQPYRGRGEQKDSLEIKQLGKVEFPYLIETLIY